MIDFFRAGGWPMWPILVTGLILNLYAVRYAQRPEPQRRGLVRSLAIVNLLTGVLGTVLGLIATTVHLAPHLPDKAYLCLIGLGESLNNLAFSLSCVLLAAIIKTVGDVRAAQGPRAAKAPPLPPNL